MKESYVLFGRMLLKTACQDIEYKDLIAIPFDDRESVKCKEMLADKEEFCNFINNRYPHISNIINTANLKESRKKDLEVQCYQHIKDFLFSVVLSLRKRLPLNNTILNNSLAVYLKQPYDIDAIWRKFASLFPLIITKEKEIAYTDEIDSFSLKYKGIIQDHKESSMSIIKRWKLLKNDYPHLVQVVKALLIIPYSTSTVESLFSEFRAFKTCYRNKLNVENLEASILTEQYFRKESPRILPKMLDKYFSMWNTDEKKKTASDEPRASEQIEIQDQGQRSFFLQMK